MLVLAFEASSTSYEVALATDGEMIHRQSAYRLDPQFHGIAPLAAISLTAVGAQFQDIDLIALDAGPGNLASVRAAVAYANGLAFSLNRSIICASSLELMSIEARAGFKGTILCAQNAGTGNVYASSYSTGEALKVQYGPLDTVIESIAKNLTEVSLAGNCRAEVAEILAGVNVKDTRIDSPGVQTLCYVAANCEDLARIVSFATPITERSDIFMES